MNTLKKPKFPFKRDWIEHGEGRLTIVQFFGFVLITFGVIYFSSFLLPDGFIKMFAFLDLDSDPTPNGIATAFFVTMLGASFAFPDLLKGQTKEISTMRIVVFMFSNVICMLLLKVGWDKNSLKEIGIDANWMGIIAFLFGAKAAQTYFEGIKKEKSNDTATTEEQKIDLARLASNKHTNTLMENFPNIECVSDTVLNGEDIVTIYLSDDNSSGIPKSLPVELSSGKKFEVPTQIIANTGKAKPQAGLGTSRISAHDNADFVGSICCLLSHNKTPQKRFVMTSGHVFTNSEFISFGGAIDAASPNRKPTYIEWFDAGALCFQQITFEQDLAIVELDDNFHFNQKIEQFANRYHQLTKDDISTAQPNVSIQFVGRAPEDAYVLDFNVSFNVYYGNYTKYIRNIILIGSSRVREDSKRLSQGGDSGSAVYLKGSNKLIGMLLGGNTKYTFVLPVEETLSLNGYKTI